MERIFSVKAKHDNDSKWITLDEVETLDEALNLRDKYRLEHSTWLSIIVDEGR